MCSSGTTCNAAGTGCVVSSSSRWYVTVVSGTVGASPMGGGSWDVDNSPPDPYVCMNTDGMQRCTPYVADTYTPRWSTMNQFPATTAAALAAGIPVLYGDDDLTTDNIICQGPVMFTTAHLLAGSTTINCAPYGTISVTLTPAP